MIRKNWTDKEDQILRRMVAAGDGPHEIGAALGRSRDSVSHHASRLGLEFDPAGIEARYRAGLAKRNMENLGVKLGHKQTLETRMKRIASLKARCADPEFLARQRERVRLMNAGRDNAAIAAKCSDTKMKWCPAYLRDDARHMTIKGVRMAERREIIGEIFARDLRRALKAIAAVARPLAEEQRRQYYSFEAELERARVKGIREVVPLVRPDYEFSLTGGSLG